MKKTGRSVKYVNRLKKLYRHADFLMKIAKIRFVRKRLEKAVKYDEMIALTKDKLISVNQDVEKPDDMILPSKVVEYFINKTDYLWIMNFCICRDSLGCKDYPSELGCLFMGEAAMGVNPELGRRVTKEEALEHVRKCREAGLIHNIGRNKLDSVWLGVKPEDKLLTVCNCCPCCCITRYVTKMSPKIRSALKRMPGVEVRVIDKCVGCGTCTKGICFANAIQLVEKKAVINDDCRGCGRCVEICPQNAIELIINDPQFIEKSIEQIDKIVDIT